MLAPLVNSISPLTFLRVAASTPTITFLIQDDYTTANTYTPRTATPGPGSLTFIRTSGNAVVTGGECVWTGKSIAGHTGLGFYDSTPRTRTNGLLLYAKAMITATLSTNSAGICFKTVLGDLDFSIGNGARYGVNFTGAPLAGVGPLGTIATSQMVEAYTTNTYYEYAILIRDQGCYIAYRGGQWADWHEMFVYDEGTESPLYAIVSWARMSGKTDNYRLTNLVDDGYTFLSDSYALATQHVAGSLSAGQAITHDADAEIKIKIGGLPSSGQYATWSVRRVDDNNYFYVRLDSSGNITLRRLLAGVDSQLISAGVALDLAGTFGPPYITVRCFGSRLELWTNEIYRGNVTDTNFQTQANGKIEALNSAAASNLSTWATTPSAALKTALDQVANA